MDGRASGVLEPELVPIGKLMAGGGMPPGMLKRDLGAPTPVALRFGMMPGRFPPWVRQPPQNIIPPSLEIPPYGDPSC